MKKRKRKARRWWTKPKVVRRVVIGLLTTGLLAAGGLWFALFSGGGHDAGTYLVQPAPAFTLPAITGEKFVSSEHRGQHNLLLYFNEGMG